IGPDDKNAVGVLQQMLGERDPEIQHNAAVALSNVGGDAAKPAIPILVASLKNGTPEMRRQAAAGFYYIGSPAASAVRDLIAALRDPDEEVRSYVAMSLGGIGRQAEEAVPVLVRIVADKKERSPVRLEAAVAMSGIGDVPAAADAVPTLLQ